MRAAHLLRKLDPAEWSGTEMAVQRLLEGLREQGVTPVIYCPRIAAGTADPLNSSGFQVQRFKAFVPIVGLSRERKQQLVSVGGNLMSFDLLPALWKEKISRSCIRIRWAESEASGLRWQNKSAYLS